MRYGMKSLLVLMTLAGVGLGLLGLAKEQPRFRWDYLPQEMDGRLAISLVQPGILVVSTDLDLNERRYFGEAIVVGDGGRGAGTMGDGLYGYKTWFDRATGIAHFAYGPADEVIKKQYRHEIQIDHATQAVTVDGRKVPTPTTGRVIVLTGGTGHFKILDQAAAEAFIAKQDDGFMVLKPAAAEAFLRELEKVPVERFEARD